MILLISARGVTIAKVAAKLSGSSCPVGCPMAASWRTSGPEMGCLLIPAATVKLCRAALDECLRQKAEGMMRPEIRSMAIEF